jgi:hypothetical protein
VTATASQLSAPASYDGTVRAALGRRAWLIAWLAFLPLVIFRAGILSEADTFWEIRAGLLTIAQRAIPAVDTFTWTVHGKPYFLNSWGFNVLLAAGYRLGGLPGVAVLCALITLGIVALALTLARSLGASAAAAGMAFFLAAPLLTGWLSARPQLVDYAAVLALALLLRSIEQGHGRWGAAALAGLLTVVWVNLHAAALLAFAMAAASAALLVLFRRGGTWRYAAAAAVAAAVSCLLNPYGTGVLHQASQVQADSTQLITEWMPVDWASPIQDLTFAAGVAALIIAWRRREAVLTAALAVGLAGSLAAVRFLPFVVILAMPVLAAFASNPPDPIRWYLASRHVMLRRCGALGLIALIALATPSLTHIGRPAPATYPVAVVVDIPHGCRLFTTDLIGGYVILARPDVPVSLDTRNNLYGPALLLAEERVLHGSGSLSRGLAGAGCVLVPASYGLARRLRHDAQWEARAAEPSGILFVRR